MQDERHFIYNIQQYFIYLFRISPVSNAYRHLYSHCSIRDSEIGYLVIYHLGVRDSDYGVIQRFYLRVSWFYLIDIAINPAEFYSVAHVVKLVKSDGDSAKNICKYILRGKCDGQTCDPHTCNKRCYLKSNS